MGTGFSKKKKQARMLQEQLSSMQSKMQQTEVTGTAGNGLVTITLTGEHQMKNITIKPECVDKDDIDGLKDLIKAAYNDAIAKLQDQNPLPQMPGGMPNMGMFGL